MIKAKATVNGTVLKQAAVRRDKEGKEMVSFPVTLKVPGSRKDTPDKEICVSVSVPASGLDISMVNPGVRIEATGTLTFRKVGDSFYLNLLADSVVFSPESVVDRIEGILEFKGTVGKSVEQKHDRKERPYVSFSAFSTEKVKDSFEFIWVRFVRFDYEREQFLCPKAKIHATGKLTVTSYEGRVSLDCMADSIKEWERVPFSPSSDNNQ